MNSNSSPLETPDLLRLILELLPPADLARAACVCKLWKDLASNRDLLERAFRNPWKLQRVLGFPSTEGFWRHTGLDRFAISHCLIPGDTIVGLAVKYSVQVNEIKRLNNMMSEHGIHSRERLLIPVGDPKLLCNGTCFIELDDYAKREVAVLYLEGNPNGRSPLLRINGGSAAGRGSRRVIDSVRRSLQVDEETAAYYLSLSNGDPRNAILHFYEDLRWDQQTGRNW